MRCSRFSVELGDCRFDYRTTIDVSADDLRDVCGLPAHHIGDQMFGNSGQVEPGRRTAAQIMKVQVAESSFVLGGGECVAETFRSPRPAATVRQHGRCALRDVVQYRPQIVVQRNAGIAPAAALAGGDDDLLAADVRP